MLKPASSAAAAISSGLPTSTGLRKLPDSRRAVSYTHLAGDPAVLVRALRIIDASSLYYHSKLLSDGLLNYTGDTWELADALWKDVYKRQTQQNPQET